MGMFDTLTCQYPLPPEGKPAGDIQFQTKDLECVMDRYRIDENGQLFRESWIRDPDFVAPTKSEDEEDNAPDKPGRRRFGALFANLPPLIFNGLEKTYFTGSVEFYYSNIVRSGPDGFGTHNDEPLDSRSYQATFVQGQVTGVNKLPDDPEEGRHLPLAEIDRLFEDRRAARQLIAKEAAGDLQNALGQFEPTLEGCAVLLEKLKALRPRLDLFSDDKSFDNMFLSLSGVLLPIAQGGSAQERERAHAILENYLNPEDGSLFGARSFQKPIDQMGNALEAYSRILETGAGDEKEATQNPETTA